MLLLLVISSGFLFDLLSVLIILLHCYRCGRSFHPRQIAKASFGFPMPPAPNGLRTSYEPGRAPGDMGTDYPRPIVNIGERLHEGGRESNGLGQALEVTVCLSKTPSAMKIGGNKLKTSQKRDSLTEVLIGEAFRIELGAGRG